MASQTAKEGRLLRTAYRWGMIGLLGVTAVAAGGHLMWEWLSPKPEPTLSARLTREYFNRFNQLGVKEILKEKGDIEVVLEGKVHLQVSELQCLLPPGPSGNAWPPQFDVEREGQNLNLYGPIDKDRFSLPEYHDAVVRCLDAGLAEAAHAKQAKPSWGAR